MLGTIGGPRCRSYVPICPRPPRDLSWDRANPRNSVKSGLHTPGTVSAKRLDMTSTQKNQRRAAFDDPDPREYTSMTMQPLKARRATNGKKHPTDKPRASKATAAQQRAGKPAGAASDLHGSLLHEEGMLDPIGAQWDTSA